jgi:hypothetical protein
MGSSPRVTFVPLSHKLFLPCLVELPAAVLQWIIALSMRRVQVVNEEVDSDAARITDFPEQRDDIRQ